MFLIHIFINFSCIHIWKFIPNASILIYSKQIFIICSLIFDQKLIIPAKVSAHGPAVREIYDLHNNKCPANF